LGLPEYSQERKDAALAKLMPLQNRRPQDVATEEGITKATAYRWRRAAKAGRRQR
jgi:transposase-like protein